MRGTRWLSNFCCSYFRSKVIGKKACFSVICLTCDITKWSNHLKSDVIVFLLSWATRLSLSRRAFSIRGRTTRGSFAPTPHPTPARSGAFGIRYRAGYCNMYLLPWLLLRSHHCLMPSLLSSAFSSPVPDFCSESQLHPSLKRLLALSDLQFERAAMRRPVGSKNVSSIQSSNVIKNKRRPEATERKESARKPKKTVPRKMTESRLRHKVDDIVGRPIDFFPFTKLPQNKVVVQRYLSVREQHKKWAEMQ